VIEFALLFALGFLAAALVALIVAPIIQRRIVTLTERRIRASVPLSAAEIRAEKDMARAAYAADNARLSIDLKQNREALAQSTAKGTRLSNELVALRAEKLTAEQTIEERDASIRELNATMHQREQEITNLSGNLGAAIRLAEARKNEIASKEQLINRLGSEIEELRIDVATLDTEAENFKAQIKELRDERRVLRDKLKTTEETNHDLAFRLKREEARLVETEAKLAKTISSLTDRENALDRRVAEVERYKEKNKSLAEELKAARRERTASETGKANAQQRGAGMAAAAKAEPPRQNPGPAAKTAASAAANGPQPTNSDFETDDTPDFDLTDSEKVDRLRARQAALTERLMKADTSKNDAALRTELATVAAMMVELTAGRGGGNSAIAKILETSEDRTVSRNPGPSLAGRARDLISASQR
jgi:DNA repair exonuclease SbcCD ATPase subunit